MFCPCQQLEKVFEIRNCAGHHSSTRENAFFAKRGWCLDTHITADKCAADAGILEHVGPKVPADADVPLLVRFVPFTMPSFAPNMV